MSGPVQVIEIDDLDLHHALATGKYSQTAVPVTAHLAQPGNGRI